VRADRASLGLPVPAEIARHHEVGLLMNSLASHQRDEATITVIPAEIIYQPSFAFLEHAQQIGNAADRM
jgi:hypothetical protein